MIDHLANLDEARNDVRRLERALADTERAELDGRVRDWEAHFAYRATLALRLREARAHLAVLLSVEHAGEELAGETV